MGQIEKTIFRLKRKPGLNWEILAWGLLLLGISGWWIFTEIGPGINDPLPLYPKSQVLKAINPLPENLLKFQCSAPFTGISYQAVTTSDNKSQVRIHFLQTVPLQGKRGLTEATGQNDTIAADTKDIFCFEYTRLFGPRPSNVLQILDPNLPPEAAIIQKFFPDAPKGQLVLLLVHGSTQNVG